MTSIMITLEKLQKVVEQRTVLKIDGLHIDHGEIAAIVGPSGSGNDVLLSLLIGQSRPTSGSVRVAGCDPASDRLSFSQRVGVLFGEDTLYTTRSPRSNLAFQVSNIRFKTGGIGGTVRYHFATSVTYRHYGITSHQRMICCFGLNKLFGEPFAVIIS